MGINPSMVYKYNHDQKNKHKPLKKPVITPQLIWPETEESLKGSKDRMWVDDRITIARIIPSAYVDSFYQGYFNSRLFQIGDAVDIVSLQRNIFEHLWDLSLLKKILITPLAEKVSKAIDNLETKSSDNEIIMSFPMSEGVRGFCEKTGKITLLGGKNLLFVSGLYVNGVENTKKLHFKTRETFSQEGVFQEYIVPFEKINTNKITITDDFIRLRNFVIKSKNMVNKLINEIDDKPLITDKKIAENIEELKKTIPDFGKYG